MSHERGQLTLYRPSSTPLPVLARPALPLRPVVPADIDGLAESWHHAYDLEGYSSGVDAARQDMEATFTGEYGPLWLAASVVAEDADGTLASVVQVVTDPPWPDVHRGPFIIEAFTRPAYRRRGLARALLGRSLAVIAEAGHERVGLRVMSGNTAALAMYESLGFAEKGSA